MTTELDLSLDYETDTLMATWEGFVTWADEGGVLSRENLLRLSLKDRQAFTEDHWPEYIEDLQWAYMDEIENQKMKWGRA